MDGVWQRWAAFPAAATHQKAAPNTIGHDTVLGACPHERVCAKSDTIRACVGQREIKVVLKMVNAGERNIKCDQKKEQMYKGMRYYVRCRISI